LELVSLAGKFILFELEEGFLFDNDHALLFHVLDLVVHVFVILLDVLDGAGDLNFLVIHAVLMVLVEVTLFPKLLPGALCVLSNDLRLLELVRHPVQLLLHLGVFILYVSNQTDA